MRRILFIIMYLLLLLVLYVDLPERVIYQEDEGFVEAFFCQDINCTTFLIDLIVQSNQTVCALYDLDQPALIKTIEARNVSVLLFEENYEETFPTSILPVSSKGLMHHKFCVFEEQYVLLGSWNPTYRGSEKNDNYVLLISSKNIAQSFLEEYDFIATRNKAAQTTHTDISGTLVSTYFCPAHDCEAKVLARLEDANESIRVLAFTFTSKPIAELLVNKSQQGVNVTVVFEKTRITQYSQYDYLARANVSVFKDGNSYTMHEKLFIVDDETVIVGSYNPTQSATTRNDENLLVISDTLLAKEFLFEFQRVLNESKQQN